MKKLFYVFLAAMLCVSFAGCDKGESDTTESAVLNAPISYSQNDFALYTTDDDLQPSKFLCMLGLDADMIDYTDENAEYVAQFLDTQTMTVKMGDKENPGQTIEQEQIRYINYTGSHDAVINVKGITTTGPVKEDDKCSTVDDVIAAYGIDTETENYIESELPDGGYVIRLNFTDADDNGNVDRIKSTLDADLNATDGRYSIRYTIVGDYVHGVEYYMYY